jgi:hypothetical protein
MILDFGIPEKCFLRETDTFSISTLKVELGELQEVHDDKTDNNEDVAAR